MPYKKKNNIIIKMGAGFAVIIHLFIVLLLSLFLGVFFAIIVFFISKEPKRVRKIILAFISPMIGLFTLYMCSLIGVTIVSALKGVDSGIGDAWYVPMENNCQLLFIDLPEQAFIQKDGQTVISDVSEIEERGDVILGKTYNNVFFLYNSNTDVLKRFQSEKELILNNLNYELRLINASDYYENKKDSIVGWSFLFVGLLSLVISLLAVYIICKLVLALPSIFRF